MKTNANPHRRTQDFTTGGFTGGGSRILLKGCRARKSGEGSPQKLKLKKNVKLVYSFEDSCTTCTR